MKRNEDKQQQQQPYVSHINNYAIVKTNEIRTISLQEICKIFNEKDDNKFLGSLGDLGYFERLQKIKYWASQAKANQDWAAFLKFPFLLAIYLNDVYDSYLPKVKNLIDLSQTSKNPIKKSDFVNIEDMPDHIFNAIGGKITKGIYSLKKELFTAVIFVTYFPNKKGKSFENIQDHANYFGLDIDLPIDNNEEALNKINKHFDIAAILYSPSGTLRPILKLNVNDTTLLDYSKWKGLELSKQELKTKRIELMKEYQKLIFNKISHTISKETVMSNGNRVNLLIDQACSNVNRIWYLGRGGDTLYNPSAKPVEISKEDYYEFKDKKDSKVIKKETLKSLRKTPQTELNLTTLDLQEYHLDYINNEILEVIIETVAICKDKNYQPLFDGSNMYHQILKLYSSISNVASKETIAFVFTELMALSKTDKRLIGTEYLNRTFENYVVPTFSQNPPNTTLFYQYIYSWKNVIEEELGIKRPDDEPMFFSFDENGKVIIDSYEFDNFLKSNYFRLKGKHSLHSKNHHLVYNIYNGDRKQEYLFFSHLDKIIKKEYHHLEDKEFHLVKAAAVKLINQNKLLTTTAFQFIDPRKYIKRDTEDTIYIYAKNKKLVIKKDSLTAIDYTDDDFILEEYIAKNHMGELIDYDEKADYRNYLSLPFFEKVAGSEKNHLFLKCLIGYMIHTHRSANSNRVPVFFDGIESLDLGGGSGKSVVAKFVSHLRHALRIVNPIYGKYTYDNLDHHTNIILDDVVWKRYSIENIKPFADLKVTVEKKYMDTAYTNAHSTPRMSITTNFFPDLEHESLMTRCIFFSPSTFFRRNQNDGYTWLGKLHNTPSGEYRVMEYETMNEWSHFLAFGIHCSQLYLDHGIEKFDALQDMIRKGVNNKKGDVRYHLLENIVKEYENESLGEMIRIPSGDLVIEWNKKLKEHNQYPKTRIGSNDQEFVEQISLKDHRVKYFNKSGNCPVGSDFTGFVLIPKKEIKSPDSIGDIFG